MLEQNEKNNPLVSIIIPTYNYAQYLQVAIESCVKQSYKNLEIIVVDDGSTDNTKEITQRFVNKIVYVYQKNMGVSGARNTGLELAKGDFITFLDADDYLTEDSIERRLNLLLERKDIYFVISTTYSKNIFDNTLTAKNKLEEDMISDKLHEALLLRYIPFQISAVLMRSQHAKQFIFPLQIANGEDIAYFTKIFFKTKGYFLAKPTAVTCSHPDSLRHKIEEIKKQDTALIDIIFDDPYYGKALNYLRKDFTAHRCFEFFRRFYNSGDKVLARKYYVKAIATKPSKIFKIDYVIKFLRTYL